MRCIERNHQQGQVARDLRGSPQTDSAQRSRCVDSVAGTPFAQTRSETASTGWAVCVRRLTREDAEGLRRMFSRLSQETIYRRFHTPYPRIPEWMFDYFLGMKHPQAESLVATVGDEIVGHAMYVPLDGGREAEVALVVEDAWQSRGVGKLLLFGLVERARVRGIETFTGAVLGENRRALGFFLAASSEIRHDIKGGAHLLRAPLSGGLRQPHDGGAGAGSRHLPGQLRAAGGGQTEVRPGQPEHKAGCVREGGR